MISMDKTYRQRNGRAFIVGAIRTEVVDPDCAVIGWSEDVNGHMVASIRRIDGTTPYGGSSQNNLIEVVPDVVRWVNVYSSGEVSDGHGLRSLTDKYAKHDRIAILKVTTKNGGANGAEDVSVEVLPVGGP